MKEAYCAATAVVVVVVCLWMFFLARSTDLTGQGLFRDWRDALRAYREAGEWGARLFLIALQCTFAVRASMWSFLVAFVCGMGAVLASLCSEDWADILREIRMMLRDLYDFWRPEHPRGTGGGSAVRHEIVGSF